MIEVIWTMFLLVVGTMCALGCIWVGLWGKKVCEKMQEEWDSEEANSK